MIQLNFQSCPMSQIENLQSYSQWSQIVIQLNQ